MSEEKKEYAGQYGQLTPCGGGDPIPLTKQRLLIGRRGECDIALQFKNVSSQHCRLTLEQGYWFLRDLNSRNGTKVSKQTIIRKRVDPGSLVAIARHEYTLDYDPYTLGAYGPPPADDDFVDEMMRQSLMDRAGIQKRKDKVFTKRQSID